MKVKKVNIAVTCYEYLLSKNEDLRKLQYIGIRLRRFHLADLATTSTPITAPTETPITATAPTTPAVATASETTTTGVFAINFVEISPYLFITRLEN
jgi:hypothetical protein